MGYTKEHDGYSEDGKRGYVFAPKGGVPGIMIPGQPKTWIKMNPGNPQGSKEDRHQARSVQRGQARYDRERRIANNKAAGNNISGLATFFTALPTPFKSDPIINDTP